MNNLKFYFYNDMGRQVFPIPEQLPTLRLKIVGYMVEVLPDSARHYDTMATLERLAVPVEVDQNSNLPIAEPEPEPSPTLEPEPESSTTSSFTSTLPPLPSSFGSLTS